MVAKSDSEARLANSRRQQKNKIKREKQEKEQLKMSKWR